MVASRVDAGVRAGVVRARSRTKGPRRACLTSTQQTVVCIYAIEMNAGSLHQDYDEFSGTMDMDKKSEVFYSHTPAHLSTFLFVPPTYFGLAFCGSEPTAWVFFATAAALSSALV